jgi:uncharacterized protein
VKNRLARWIGRHIPTRESMEANRWLRPIAHRVLAPRLWRMTRRSVPRGVALGLLTGILIPLGQIPAAAVLAFPLRANIPVAAATTFITNPITMGPLWLLAYQVGRWVLQVDDVLPGDPVADAADDIGWFHWLLAEAGPATVTGLATLSVLGAVTGFVVSTIAWRWWVARKWKRRSRQRN